MADRVDAAVNAMQATGANPVKHGVLVEPCGV